MITVECVTKVYGKKKAVDEASFVVRSGAVTGLIGPNGSGKSTTMRMILGLTKPTAGKATIDGNAYRDIRWPLHSVGALLDNALPVPERRGVDHLTWIAQTNGMGKARVREVLSVVGLERAAKIRVQKYSLGMKQRLGIAAAILGDPDTLVLDEPMNGLDPEGIQWIRTFMKARADAGGTVLVSSHFMKELESVAENIVLLSHGKVRADGTVAEVVAGFPSLEAAYFDLTSGVAV